jgi:hypothetical protein
MEKVRGRANRQVRADSPMADEAEVEKSFWLSRPDGWVINRKTKKIILLEFNPYPTGSWGPGGRGRLGGRSRPAGRRSAVGQRKGVASSPHDLRDRVGRRSEDHRQTGPHSSRRT